MEKKNLLSLVEQALPALSGNELTYNANTNTYLTTGWTSATGNTYFQALRGSSHILVVFDVAIGYVRTFLNGIRLYGFDNQKPMLIAQRQWGGVDNWRDYSENFAKNECVEMLSEYLQGQCKLAGVNVTQQQLLSCANKMMDETQVRQERTLLSM